jgi:hypothetical protein
MLSKQEEDRERRETLRNDASVRDQHLDPVLKEIRELEQRPGGIERAKAIAEAKASTLSDHHHNDTGGRWSAQDKQTVTGATPAQAWPKLPMESPWSGEQPGPGTERSFGQQLHSFDVPLNIVSEKKR